MAELHLENAARALQRILNARDRDQTWIVEVGPRDLDDAGGGPGAGPPTTANEEED